MAPNISRIQQDGETMTKRTLEKRIDFLEATVSKLWDEVYKLQQEIEKARP
jgi:chaperonin cofactor prefoldin